MKNNATKLPGSFIIDDKGFSVYSSAAQPKSQPKAKKEGAKEGPKEVSADTAKIEKAILGFMDKNKGVIENTEEFAKKENI